MRVIHVAPTPFGATGLLGGGERYPLELARALAAETDCELVTFGRRPNEVPDPSGLQIRTLPALAYLGGHPAHPLAPGLPGALAHADLVHTHHMRSTPSAPPRRTRVIYGGADPERFRLDPAATRRGVLFVGRLTPHKGVERLIEALPGGAQLRVAGSAGHDRALPERAYPLLLRRLASVRDVTFLGPVPDDRLPSLYSEAAVLALPSVQRTCYGRWVPVSELLGLAALEAMASGTPVVCSRLGGLPEVVRDGLTGFLVEPGDGRQLGERLDQVLNDPALAARLGRNARELVLERFTWQKCARRCLAAYGELVGG